MASVYSYENGEQMLICDWHRASDNLPDEQQIVPATTHCQNPAYSGYDLCEECATHLDSDQADWPYGREAAPE